MATGPDPIGIETDITTRNELRYYKQQGKPRLPGGNRTCDAGTPIGVPYEQRDMTQNGKPNSPTKKR